MVQRRACTCMHPAHACIHTHTDIHTQAQAHTHQGLILTEGRHLPSYFHFLSPRLCWLLSNREASFPGSGIGGREGVEASGKRRNQACLDIPDGAFLQYTPHPPQHILSSLASKCAEPWRLKGREERGGPGEEKALQGTVTGGDSGNGNTSSFHMFICPSVWV